MGMLLSRAEAAAYLGISAKLLDGFRKDGKISYVQRVPGGKVFLSKEELRQFRAVALSLAREESIFEHALPFRTGHELRSTAAPRVK